MDERKRPDDQPDALRRIDLGGWEVSAWRSFTWIRGLVVLAIGVPYAISIVLEGGPRNSDETAALFAISGALLALAAIAIAALDRRQRAVRASLEPAEAGTPMSGATRLGRYILLVGITFFLLGIAVGLSADVDRSGWTFKNLLGGCLGILVGVLWLSCLRSIFFPNRRSRKDPAG
jgi:hypothetical protein